MKYRKLTDVREIPIISNQWALELYTRKLTSATNANDRSHSILPRAIKTIFSYIANGCSRLMGFKSRGFI